VERVSSYENLNTIAKFCECKLPEVSVRTSTNCEVLSFFDGVSEFAKCNNTYIIKGIASDMYEYGRNFRFIEDLKGNFPKNVSSFIVWGDGGNYPVERIDRLNSYNDQDVLIMHLMTAKDYLFDEDTLLGLKWLEKSSDFCTFTCKSSVLKLSDNKVIGHIFHNEGTLAKDSISIEDFKKKLKELLKIK